MRALTTTSFAAMLAAAVFAAAAVGNLLVMNATLTVPLGGHGKHARSRRFHAFDKVINMHLHSARLGETDFAFCLENDVFLADAVIITDAGTRKIADSERPATYAICGAPSKGVMTMTPDSSSASVTVYAATDLLEVNLLKHSRHSDTFTATVVNASNKPTVKSCGHTLLLKSAANTEAEKEETQKCTVKTTNFAKDDRLCCSKDPENIMNRQNLHQITLGLALSQTALDLVAMKNRDSPETEALDYVNKLVTAANNLIYNEQLNTVFVVKAIDVSHNSQKDTPCNNKGDNDNSDRLNKFSLYRIGKSCDFKQDGTVVACQNEQNDEGILWHLLDGCGSYSGIAYTGTLCMDSAQKFKGEKVYRRGDRGLTMIGQKNVATAAITDNDATYGAWQTFAHELGHIFGAHHPFMDVQDVIDAETVDVEKAQALVRAAYGAHGGIMDYRCQKIDSCNDNEFADDLRINERLMFRPGVKRPHKNYDTEDPTNTKNKIAGSGGTSGKEICKIINLAQKKTTDTQYKCGYYTTVSLAQVESTTDVFLPSASTTVYTHMTTKSGATIPTTATSATSANDIAAAAGAAASGGGSRATVTAAPSEDTDYVVIAGAAGGSLVFCALCVSVVSCLRASNKAAAAAKSNGESTQSLL